MSIMHKKSKKNYIKSNISTYIIGIFDILYYINGNLK